MAEWLKASILKIEVGDESTVGSNPNASANILYEWMVHFLLEDDRSRYWTRDELIENLSLVRPEIRPYIVDYHVGGFDMVFRKHRKEIYESLRLNAI